ncbi:hypothetical protein [Providencia phage PSTRCR_127]|nr:hypothetical protein [Providencia phage PSTRCR_127]
MNPYIPLTTLDGKTVFTENGKPYIMKTNVFLELFQSKYDICSEFNIPEETLDNVTIVLAFYEYENYSGDATVVYRDENGIFWHVEGGHCSCYGLEDQWDPVEIGDIEIFKEYSKRMTVGYYSFGSDSKTIYDLVFN